MTKLDTKDLALLGAIVAEGNHFLLGRANGTIIMDSETTELLEGICMGLSLLGDTLVQECRLWSKDQLAQAGVEKLLLLKGGDSIEEIIFDALRKNKPAIIAKIREHTQQAQEMSLPEAVADLVEDAQREANSN